MENIDEKLISQICLLNENKILEKVDKFEKTFEKEMEDHEELGSR